jgi:hypothetical protein
MEIAVRDQCLIFHAYLLSFALGFAASSIWKATRERKEETRTSLKRCEEIVDRRYGTKLLPLPPRAGGRLPSPSLLCFRITGLLPELESLFLEKGGISENETLIS